LRSLVASHKSQENVSRAIHVAIHLHSTRSMRTLEALAAAELGIEATARAAGLAGIGFIHDKHATPRVLGRLALEDFAKAILSFFF